MISVFQIQKNEKFRKHHDYLNKILRNKITIVFLCCLNTLMTYIL